jgi:hypothetical protein
MTYGVFFAFALLLYSKPYLLWGHKQIVLLSGKKISSNVILLPFLFFVFISFIIFTVFRDSSVGYDYGGYMKYFNLAEGRTFFDYITYMSTMYGIEPLYSMLSYIVYKYIGDFLLLLFIIYTVTFFSQIKLLSRVKNLSLSLGIYLILFYPIILESFNITRNCFAVFIAIFGYIYLDKKKYFMALLFFVIATLIHYTASFCLLVWIMYIISNKEEFCLKKIIFLTSFGIFITIILSRFITDIVLTISPNKLGHLDGNGVSIKIMSFYVIVFIISLVYSKRLIAHNRFNRVMIVVLGAIITTIPLQAVLELINRMVYFSYVAMFFIICEIFSVVKITRKNLMPVICMFVIVIILSLGWFYTHVTDVFIQYGITSYKNMLF